MDQTLLLAARRLAVSAGLTLSIISPASLEAGEPCVETVNWYGGDSGCQRGPRPCEHHHHYHLWPCCKRDRDKDDDDRIFFAREAPRAEVLPAVPARLLAETAIPIRRAERLNLELAVRERAPRESRVVELTEQDLHRLARLAGVIPEKTPPKEETDSPQPPKCCPQPCGPVPCAALPSQGPEAAATGRDDEVERLRRQVAELVALTEELRQTGAADVQQVDGQAR
ncbi:MAG: hypothetical protein M3552_17295 [Planctomycetota bacterium]|nr:hypothetical protein [Planctomycetota bacterium]